MKLTIKSIEMRDFGSYKCLAKNSLGDTDGSIKLYRKYFEKFIVLRKKVEAHYFKLYFLHPQLLLPLYLFS